MNKITKIIIKLLIEKLMTSYKTRGRNNKVDIDHYLDEIGRVLKSGVPWKCINSKLHYTTYHKKFLLLNKNKIFDLAHKIIIVLLKHKKLIKVDDLFIDSTMIKNIHMDRRLRWSWYKSL